MKRGILLDTGPLIAFLNRRDEYHEWAIAQWSQIAPPDGNLRGGTLRGLFSIESYAWRK